MMVKFKPEFESELKRLQVKRRFVNNLKAIAPLSRKRINELDSEKDFESFIKTAIVWNDTPEGAAYWETVSKGRHVIKFKI